MDGLTNKNFLVLVGGRSRIGKTSIVNKLIELFPEKYQRPISYTTRPRRKDESAKEYRFVTLESFSSLSASDNFVTVDEAYGNLYGISTTSINQVFSSDKTPIKEVHPANFNKMKKKYAKVVTVLVEGRVTGEDERMDEDEDFYSSLDFSLFDIIIRNDRTNSIEALALELHKALNSLFSFCEKYPLPSQIDSLNRRGYDTIASEFTDDKRVTTHNFHTSSIPFFEYAVNNYIREGDKVLEIGPGQNWLSSNFHFPEIDYHSVDVSGNMMKHLGTNNGRDIVGSIRNTFFPSGFFDIVIASLADPFFYPASLSEIYRIVKTGGRFIFTIPSSEWSSCIREKGNANKTKFLLSDRSYSEVFSFTYSLEELRNMLVDGGFQIVYSAELTMDRSFEGEISPAISMAAQKKAVDIYDLVILNALICTK